ncbi:MAG: 4-(cytidine 5'-diphospho)-2-C-methyl-D-erythritol kinase [Gammaproteobacteria bacterium]|nr:4-(cytidine 5'-diphospho)-2-C-methyl-D-erythritol kinase [Gammaproteobacteria bacterium]NIR84627.1 4-(cytidine 5'-diphospho)-2-C-methyl-D-erythritol kinase [Gammaproteobacteria bacterium]NIR90530.1 4-(cytidine 5'-diphospho)-2-C-methyl-D-erythritol kinase [Gammaproteobacteria bacterium]NIU05678.1 4-(cytidine 5'-diphospho)-2-C-methyl-D-erythritol kinase [Gammaproteobacteria bacterium]NIV52817.1 4-(cytidine 5'-diphospho)-2-C-methyl-D-erythritol kinase [Gammaproteobacteria bacterium]
MQPADTVWPAPAKLNLFLHVIGRRRDGYHTLQTVFQFLDHSDELRLHVRRDGDIRRHGDVEGLPPECDLTVRAARLLQSTSGTALGADIEVTKRIPMEAGLGGGSSDAATTLVALNRLWDLGLSVEALAELGLRLGADVPVFVRGRAAWAEGVGEILTPVVLDEPWYLVVDPGCRISTAEVFSAPALTRSTPPLTINSLVQFKRSGDSHCLTARRLLELARNDCEAWVRGHYPQVDEVLRWLSAFGPARMTGTGACCFLPLAAEREGDRLLQRIPRRWRGFVARGVNVSPLARC